MAPDTSTNQVASTRPAWLDVAFWVTLGLALLPLVASALRVVLSTGSDWYPSTDYALIEGQVRAIGHHAVVSGPYSRAGFQFPGPMLFYVLALPYRLLGSESMGLLLGTLAVNAAAIAGMGLVARRRAGTAFGIIVLLGALAVVRSFGAGLLIDPWNPSVALLPFGLLVLLAWATACGDGWMLPVTLGVASFVVQSHVGYSLVAACVLVYAVVGLVVTRRRRRGVDGDVASRWRAGRVASVSLLVVAACWFAPVVDQLTSGDNLGKIALYFRHNTGDWSWTESLRVVALQGSWRPDWLVGARRPDLGVPPMRSPIDVPVLLLLGIVATALAFAWRRRVRTMLPFAGIVWLGLAAAVASMHRISGPMFRYLVSWTWLLGALLGMLVAWAAVEALASIRAPWVRRVPIVAGALALGLLVVATSISGLDATPPRAEASAQVRSIGRQIAENLPPEHGPVFIEGKALDGFTWEVELQLLRNGYTVKTSYQGAFYFGNWLLGNPHEKYTDLLVRTGPAALAALAEPPEDTRVIASSTPPDTSRSTRERRETLATVRYLSGRRSKAVDRAAALLGDTTVEPAVVVLALER